jgi:ketosteroid isomerase-like protein
MSEENVQIVRALIAEIWSDPDEPLDLTGRVHPRVEVVSQEGFPEQRFLFGLSGFERWTTRWSETFEDYDLQPEHFWHRGDEVVVALRERGRARRSGIQLEERYLQVWTLRGGLVVRVRVFTSRDEALEAAGLRE